MTLSVAIKGEKELQRDMKKISDSLVINKILFNVGAEVKRTISNDTDRGVDYNGKPFVGYEESTKQHRKDRGRQTGHVDLQDRRHMLNDIDIKTNVSRGTTTVGFKSNTERRKAFFHTETGVGNDKTKREFFGIGAKLQKSVVDLYDKYLGQVFR